MCWLVFQIHFILSDERAPFFSLVESVAVVPTGIPPGVRVATGTGSAWPDPTRSSFEEGMEIHLLRCRLAAWANLRLLVTKLTEEKPCCCVFPL